MKKVTIALLSLIVGAVAIIGLTRSGVVDFTPSSNSKEDPKFKTPTISCSNKKAVYYNEDLPSFQSEGVPFEVTYSSPSLGIEKATTPNASGSWIANIKTLATPNFTESESYYPFKYAATDVTTLNTYFTTSTDSWGNNGTISVIPSGEVVSKNGYSYLEDTIQPTQTTSFYRLSKYDFDASRKFTVYASNNINNYGAFAFWLSDVDKTTGKEVTMEIMKSESIFATATSVDSYVENRVKNASDYCDGFIHRYDIQLFTDKVEFSIDNKVIYTIKDNIPSMELCKVQFGLMYPQNPAWSGKGSAEDKPVTVRVSQYEMYDSTTSKLTLD